MVFSLIKAEQKANPRKQTKYSLAVQSGPAVTGEYLCLVMLS